ncbi:MAG TPA: mannitol dehydrogenase family protein [Candidatus Microbacterium pullistercoris]|nr:mannitol dehydrogenase family protein [Candidatus Microbacterium pullistercoris]
MSGAILRGRESPMPPVRIIHMGLGAFHRSHLAWYTAHAGDSEQWGIAAYTGRSAGLADDLTAQDGLYTLVVRSPAGDEAERIGSIVRAHPGTDIPSFLNDVAAPETVIVSVTITEAAYAEDQTSLDRTLLADAVGDDLATARPVTAIGRLVLGLEARRRAGSGALALVSCDNLPDNGGVLRRAVRTVAAGVAGLVGWIDAHVSFVSSSVDRITPRLSDEEATELTQRYGDRAPVVAEPYSDWVIAGEFPAGRPRWEVAGARFTDDLEPWEARKLWLLNGAHTLLASLGRLRQHHTVSEAIADAECLRAVDGYWDEACRHLPTELKLDEYRAALLDRFRNPRIRHLLAQIAVDAETKLRVRIAPVAERERRAGRSGDACAAVIAAWVTINGRARDRSDVERAVASLSPALGADAMFVDTVLEAARSLGDLTLG